MVDRREVRNAFIAESFRLSKMSPPTWDAFNKAFREYVAYEVEKSVAAAPDTALVAHGRAQALLALRDDFQQIESLQKQIATKQSR